MVSLEEHWVAVKYLNELINDFHIPLAPSVNYLMGSSSPIWCIATDSLRLYIVFGRHQMVRLGDCRGKVTPVRGWIDQSFEKSFGLSAHDVDEVLTS